MSDTDFWVDDITALFDKLTPFPTPKMTLNQKLNALTIMAVIATGILVYIKFPLWHVFFVTSLLVIVIVKYTTDCKRMAVVETYTVPDTTIESADILPTIPSADDGEWQVHPPTYANYELLEDSQKPMGEYNLMGEYMTRTNLLPADEAHVANMSLADSKVYMHNQRTTDQLAYRNDMVRIFKNRINREYGHGCSDALSPQVSYLL
uniref:Minor capsid protein P9 transmembrane helices domain-containing protein n=1 Tax=viral metagenome TaxID=1070528 RepID=A0A6C0M195_9ZZZZ